MSYGKTWLSMSMLQISNGQEKRASVVLAVWWCHGMTWRWQYLPVFVFQQCVVAFVFGIVFSFTFVFVFGIVFSFVFVFVFQQGGAMARPGSASLATEQFMATVYSKLLATNNGHQPDSVDNKTSQLVPSIDISGKIQITLCSHRIGFLQTCSFDD